MKDTSVFLSLILRHKPEVIDIQLDKHGYADTAELIDKINKNSKYRINIPILEEIVRTDNKQRYSFNYDKTKIRANQGHSINVDVELKETVPPEVLYHGTGEKYISSIKEEGLKSKSRLYVHLSDNTKTASDVGNRHGKAHVLEIAAGEMHRNGYVFYLSENNVWLTKYVPKEFITDANTTG